MVRLTSRRSLASTWHQRSDQTRNVLLQRSERVRQETTHGHEHCAAQCSMCCIPRFRARGVSCHTCSSGSVGSHRAPLPDDYHFELPDPSTTATGKPTTYLIAASNTKGAQPMQAELGNTPACLSHVCPCSHTLIQRPYRFPRALSGAIEASYAGRPSVRTVSAATRSSIARATCKAQWQKDFWRLLLACVVVPRFRIWARIRALSVWVFT
jgi:hypothetical protein